jgi:inosine-uridine nucleoside N-ribohydrolase
MNRASCILSLILCILFVYSHQDNTRTKRTKYQNSKIPVIIDTDIGTDIDDTWAIAYLLNRPEVDVKLILTETHDTLARTKVLAKFLYESGRTDVPIGLGLKQDNLTGPNYGALYSWAESFDLSTYTGPFYQDGVAKMVEIIQASLDPVVLVEIAPASNLLPAFAQYPMLNTQVYVASMGGSFFTGYNGKAPTVPEYNIVDDIKAAQLLYSTDWLNFVNAPLDLTAWAQIGGMSYQKLLNSNSQMTKVLMDNFRYWFKNCDWGPSSGVLPINPVNISSTLHDLVTASFVPLLFGNNPNGTPMAFFPKWTTVNNEGYTVIVKQGTANSTQISQAMNWDNYQMWVDDVVQTLQ